MKQIDRERLLEWLDAAIKHHMEQKLKASDLDRVRTKSQELGMELAYRRMLGEIESGAFDVEEPTEMGLLARYSKAVTERLIREEEEEDE